MTHQKAIECYEKAIEIDPQSNLAWYNMGVAYENLGNHKKAVECYEKAKPIDE
ncbi:MAG: tetratricopeptide repeat protein [Promethearchaeota archaeon]